jgi:cytochrome c oxidase subunit 2
VQQLAWWLTLAGVLLVGASFGWVALAAPPRRPADAIGARAQRLRGWLFAAAAVAFVPITALSLGALPYGAKSEGALVVDAVGHQWYWELSRSRVPVGRDIVFRVRSADVNHGFAVYDPELRVVGQTQAMPGYENLLALRFERAGNYRILCLEYCGSVHHGMQAVLEVVAEEEP